MTTQSASVATIVPAIIRAKQKMAPIRKISDNSHFKSKYANLEEVVTATSEALASEGLLVVQGGTTSVVTTIYHESGEWITPEPMAFSAVADPQKMAAASTYGRRYGWLGAFGLAAEDDDGNTAAGLGKGKKVADIPPPEESLIDRARRLGIDDLRGEIVALGQEYNKGNVRAYLDFHEFGTGPMADESKPVAPRGKWKMSDAQRNMLMALHSKAGHKKPAQRLKFYSELTGRDILSSSELTRDEYEAAIEGLGVK